MSKTSLNFKLYELRALLTINNGDIEKVYADTGLANRDFGWQAETTLKETMRSAWKWEQKLNKEK